jgi:hypothetical protein
MCCRDALHFAVGFTRRGCWRDYVFLSWERGSGGATQLQINLVNIGDRLDRAMRFAPEGHARAVDDRAGILGAGLNRSVVPRVSGLAPHAGFRTTTTARRCP